MLSPEKKIKIVTVGGGSGGFVIDRGLSQYFDNLVSVTTSFDSGGSSGVLRDEFGILPQGDIRRRILAQSHTDTQVLRELFSYRFEQEKSSLHDHSLGNLILTAATKIWGNQEGIDTIAKLFGVKGRVLPVSFGNSDLQIILSDGNIITGETQIDTRDMYDLRTIAQIRLTENVFINKEVQDSLLSADYVILCPGDFYTSLIPNLITSGFTEAISQSKAEILYFPNFMTKASETANFTLHTFVTTLEKYLKRHIDYIFVDSNKISDRILDTYKTRENAEVVALDMDSDTRVRYVDLQNTDNNILRHSSELCAKAVLNHIYKKVFIWDLDDTIFQSSTSIDIIKNNSEIFCYNNVKEVLESTHFEHILVTAYTYGSVELQNRKIDSLGIRHYFKDIYVCTNTEEKEQIFARIIKESNASNAHIYVIGDRHDAELLYSKKLGLKTVCVGIENGKYLNKEKHTEYDYVVDTDSDFLKLLQL
ncbi:MAG: hypothetical protein RI996_74 [Candidatus Parcubacteria bacterium]|jgi:uncharacterized cofD-like protein